MHERNVHHRIFAAERRVFDQDAKARFAQPINARADIRESRNNFIRHFGQAQPFADDAVFDCAFEDFRQRLAARFHHRVARGHAVADVKVADDVDGDESLRAVFKALVR